MKINFYYSNEKNNFFTEDFKRGSRVSVTISNVAQSFLVVLLAFLLFVVPLNLPS
jgi:hypothetical protein